MVMEDKMSRDNRTVDRIQAVWNILGGEKGVDDLLAGTTHVVRKVITYIVATFTIPIDETVSVEDVVKAGKFDWINSDINSANFPKLADGQRLGEIEVFLFHFGMFMSSELVITEMDKAGYKPANIWILIYLAIKEPDLQKGFSIVALGSVCRLCSQRRVPFLCEGSSGRHLNLRNLNFDWGGSCRFLAVCK